MRVNKKYIIFCLEFLGIFLLPIIVLASTGSGAEGLDMKTINCQCNYSPVVAGGSCANNVVVNFPLDQVASLVGVQVIPTTNNCLSLLNIGVTNGVVCKKADGTPVGSCKLINILSGNAFSQPEWVEEYGVSPEKPVEIKKGDTSKIEIYAKLDGSYPSPLKIICVNCFSAELKDNGGGKATITWDTAKEASLTQGSYSLAVRASRIDIPEIYKDAIIYYKVVGEQEIGVGVGETEGIVIPDVTGMNGLGKLGLKGDTKGINTLIGIFLKIAIGIMGAIAFALFVYAGFLWMTGMGSSEKQGQAMKILVWSSLGIIIILSSYALVRFVFSFLP